MLPALLCGALTLLCLVGCEGYGRFRADGTSVFRGRVYGDEEASFLRRGFPAGSAAELTFDPNAAQQAVAGTLSITAPDGTEWLSGVALESIQPLAHDALSGYSFPGSAQVANYLFLARPLEGRLDNRDVMVFVSLLETGEIELRVIAGTGDETRGDVYGVFRMQRGPR